MPAIDNVYTDAGLTTQFDSDTMTIGGSAANGSSGDGSFYVGTPVTANKLEDSTNPGIDQIVLSIADSNGGSGVATTDYKLALTAVGLDSAVAGDPLNLGATILGGAGGAVQVHYRFTNSGITGTDTDISFDFSSFQEVAQ